MLRRRRGDAARALLLVILAGVLGCGGDSKAPEGDASGRPDSALQSRIDAAEKRLRNDPNDRAALVELVRGHYSLAAVSADRESGTFDERGKEELAKASDAWKRYLATDPDRPVAALATLMLTVYGPTGLNEPASAVHAAELVALARSDSASYVQLVQYASLAGQTRKAELAADKALELAPKAERDEVRRLIEQARAASG